MVTQTLISFKVDTDQLALLDRNCVRLGFKRNKFLNFLVNYGNVMLDDPHRLHLLQAYSRALVVFDDVDV